MTRDEPKKRRRLPPGARKAKIIEDAALHFAENGFAATTRDLARAMGITQALLYRYFPSKQDLIDAVFQTVFIDRWRPEWGDFLNDRKVPLEVRLNRFYTAYFSSSSYNSMRLFMRGALDNMRFPDRYTFSLDRNVMRPIIAEMRHDAGLPGLAETPLTNGERELAMMLHGSLVFFNIRRFIYGTPLPDEIETQVALHVETFLPGARQRLIRLHADPPPDSRLAAPLPGDGS